MRELGRLGGGFALEEGGGKRGEEWKARQKYIFRKRRVGGVKGEGGVSLGEQVETSTWSKNIHNIKIPEILSAKILSKNTLG